MSSPYIGVSCFTTAAQVAFALSKIPLDPDHELMVGISTSAKVLRGEPIKPKWQKRMADPTRFDEIFSDDFRAFNMIHYASDDSDNFYLDLFTLHKYSEKFDGIQLNIVWPSIRALDKYRNKWPRTELILNLFPPNLEIIGGNPQRLAEQLFCYLPFIDGVLIDASGGQGKQLDPKVALGYLRELSRFPYLSLGVAGGLGPDNLNLLDGLIDWGPDLSIDAESGLRDENNEMDLNKVVLYLQRAYSLLE